MKPKEKLLLNENVTSVDEPDLLTLTPGSSKFQPPGFSSSSKSMVAAVTFVKLNVAIKMANKTYFIVLYIIMLCVLLLLERLPEVCKAGFAFQINEGDAVAARYLSALIADVSVQTFIRVGNLNDGVIEVSVAILKFKIVVPSVLANFFLDGTII